jgi:hypothetical protein
VSERRRAFAAEVGGLLDRLREMRRLSIPAPEGVEAA